MHITSVFFFFSIDYAYNRSRSAPAMESPPDFLYAHIKSFLKLLQQINLSDFICHRDGRQGDEVGDDLTPLKPEMKNRVFKAENSKVSDTNVTTDSPINENDDYYSKIIDTVLITLHVAPALFMEIYTCLQQSPVFHAAMKSLYNDTPTQNVTPTAIP